MTDSNRYIRITVSPFRRWIGIMTLGALGILLLVLALHSDGVWAQAGVLLGAFATLWLCIRMYFATQLFLELTEDALRDSTGEVLFYLSDVQSISRGVFAFKPSNGFSVKLKTSASFQWHPGLWWRIGRHVGIGGVTPPALTKSAAEAVQQYLNVF